jgi:hypothetical protein
MGGPAVGENSNSVFERTLTAAWQSSARRAALGLYPRCKNASGDDPDSSGIPTRRAARGQITRTLAIHERRAATA